jgi:hypothetical protein
VLRGLVGLQQQLLVLDVEAQEIHDFDPGEDVRHHAVTPRSTTTASGLSGARS